MKLEQYVYPIRERNDIVIDCDVFFMLKNTTKNDPTLKFIYLYEFEWK